MIVMDFKKLREDFPVLNKNIIYFDSAASSLKPTQVLHKIRLYYEELPVNVHRGIHKLSMKASVIYEEAHEKVADFIGSNKKEVIFTANSTDSINQVMYMLYNSDYFQEGDEILTTVQEHHVDIVPWQFISKKLNLKLKFVKLNNDFSLDVNDFKEKLSNKTKLVAIAHVSNTLGTIMPIKEITKLAHEVNSLVLIDGSQSIPHMKFNFKEVDCDFLAFTAHKMLGPTGIGCLIGKEELLNKFSPVRFGGDMISNVTFEKSEWNTLPYKFEAGTPNISGVFGLGAAIDYLNKVGLENIEKHDKQLLKYCYNKIKDIKNLEIINCKDLDNQAPIILFRMKGILPVELSGLLDDISEIATRAGMHCAQPIVSSFDKNGLVRASFYFYNTFEEIDVFAETLQKISESLYK